MTVEVINNVVRVITIAKQGPPGPGGATTFIALEDVPNSYAGQAGKFVRVKADASGLEFVSSSASVAWGSITGTLSAQADLQAALDAKMNVGAAAGGELAGTYPNPTILNSAVIAKVLTGFAAGAGVVAATDSILQALQKIVGNIASLVTGVSSVFGRTGAVTAQSGDYNTLQVTENTNLYFTDGRAQAAITGGASSIVTADLTASRALVSSAGGKVAVSAVTATELGYLSGVTSAIQTQLNAKLSNITGLVTQGTNITITGTGTAGDPYVINASGSVGSAFNSITSGTNTTAAMVVGSGASLAATGSGTIVATSCTGNAATATALATARNINGVAFDGTANITVTAAAGTLTGNTLNASVTIASIGRLAGLTTNGIVTTTGSDGTLVIDTTAYVPQTRTVNGHALSSNVTVTASDVGLGSVTNDAQTKAAIVPNTVPTAGQILVGNAGGTAYAAVSASGDLTLSATGVFTIGAGKVTNAMLAGSIAASKLVGTDIATVGTITAGTWNGTAIAVAYGGTGATTASGARTNLGVALFQKTFFTSVGANVTIPLFQKSTQAFTISALKGLQTTSGTITGAIQINGVNVTGLSALSVTSTPQDVSASAANTVAVGDKVTLVLSSNSSAVDLTFTIDCTL